MKTEAFTTQVARWPSRGRHILAQFDDTSVIVYQAYRASIGHHAAAHGDFLGGGFSLDRMSWIKPNFLWMMYRCGWAQKEGQEVVLAVSLLRTAFDEILAAAVPSSHDTRRYATREDWQRAVARSDVRLQWDPDHGPSGNPVERRAIQLGLRGRTLAQYAKPWIVSIEDITPFVREQHIAFQRGGRDVLVTPREEVYPCAPATAEQLGIDSE
ncbi:MAG: DUF4291 domain-containing protein [Kofleriaceae bacterium]